MLLRGYPGSGDYQSQAGYPDSEIDGREDTKSDETNCRFGATADAGRATPMD
jgi:hypothetical protein